MAGLFDRAGTYWKAAAGCAICASLVAGVIEDTRYWIWDRTVGYFFPAQATFDTCLSRQIPALQRPEGALYQVIVTVPLGDRDQVAFRTIETSLTQAYGETQGAAIRVGALDCEPLKPRSGDTADRLATAEARADALLAGTGADVVLWGEVYADGRTMQLRFAHSRDPAVTGDADRAAVYEAGAITLDLNFGADIGALIAARALARTIEIGFSDRLDQGILSSQVLSLLAPLVASRPPGMSDENYAEVLFSEGLAAATAARATADGAALLAASDRLLAASVLFPVESAAKREYVRLLAAYHRANAASLLPAAEASAALQQAIAEFDELGPNVEALFGAQLSEYLQSVLGLAITLDAVLDAEPERSRKLKDGTARLRKAAAAQPDTDTLLNLSTGLLAQIAVSDSATASALIIEATAANDRAIAGLPEGDRGLLWLRASTVKGQLLVTRLLGGVNPETIDTLDTAIAVLSEAQRVAAGTDDAPERAKVDAVLGWAQIQRAYQSIDPVEVAELTTQAEANLRAALTVYGPTVSPFLYGWTLNGLAYASLVCAETPGCGNVDAEYAEAATRFADAAEGYRFAGQDGMVAGMLDMAARYGAAP